MLFGLVLSMMTFDPVATLVACWSPVAMMKVDAACTAPYAPHSCVSSGSATQWRAVMTRFGAMRVPVQKLPSVPIEMYTTESLAAVSGCPLTIP